MINPNLFDSDPENVRESLRRRHSDEETIASIDAIVALSDRRRTLISERDQLRSERNSLSKQIGQLFKAGKREEAEALKQQVTSGSERTKQIEAILAEVVHERDGLCLRIPNLLHDDVPDGKTEEDNPVVRSWGDTPAGDPEKSHVEIGEALGILDLERSAKLAGARFAILKGPGARLERALINFFLDLATTEHGYTEVMVPYLVHGSVLQGTGQLPKFEADMFKLEGELNGSAAYLVPTAEVPVTNIHREEILEEDTLPRKFASFTPCFRSEAGSAGRDVRGLIRQHQFHKVELVWLTTPERADQDHQALLSHAEAALKMLGLPYRVVLHCGGEVSFSATRCYDLEVWLPSQNTYREISSVSWFGDFQARRMQLRYRPQPVNGKKQKPRLAHTLNGSGLAVGRTLVAILENYVQPDGTVIVPEVLRPYMGGLASITPLG